MEPIIYDAFISYSHSDPDAYVAERLQSMLEHYHIPRKLQELTGKRKVSRVFRDRAELPLSSDLAANICQALENSEFLIVICSPRSAHSQWVLREIEMFLKTHEKDKILTVLVEGEPSEAFPEILCYNEERVIEADGREKTIRTKAEPIAADVRGRTRRETRKKLKEEFLRILAPMLSCTYDMLRQRHREYLLRRAIALTGTAAVLAIGFTAYAFCQASVSEGRYQEARRNQARYLSAVSGELLAAGDRQGALQTALAIQPEDESADEPVVPEQMYALNNALYSYDAAGKICFRPETSFELEGQVLYGIHNSGKLSPEETGYFCVDDLGNAYVLDPQSGACIWEIPPGSMDLGGTDSGSFLYFSPVSEEHAVLVGEHAIIYADWKKQTVRNFITGNFVNCIYAVQGQQIILTNGTDVWVYELESGECLYQVRYTEDEYGYNPNALSFQEEGSMAAIGVSDDYFHMEEEAGLFLMSLEDGSLRKISDEHTERTVFLGENRVAAIQYRYPEGMDEAEEAPEMFFYTAVYDTGTGEQVWRSESCRTQAVDTPCILLAETMKVNGEEQEILAASVKDRVFIFQADDGSVIQDRSYSGDIRGIVRYDGTRLLAGLNDGRIMICSTGYMLTDFEGGKISAEISGFQYSEEHHKVIWAAGDSRRIIFGNIFTDENMQGLSIEETISGAEYFTLEDRSGEKMTYRCVLWEDDSGCTGLTVYEAGSAEEMFTYRMDPGEFIFSVQIMNLDGCPCAVIENSDTREPIIGDLETGEVISAAKETGTEETSGWSYFNLCYFKNAEQAVVYQYQNFAVAEVTPQGISIPDTEPFAITENEEEWSSIDEVYVTADDRYAVFIIYLSQTDSYDSGYEVRIWDLEDAEWCAIEGETIRTPGSGRAAVGQETAKAAVQAEDGTIQIIDAREGKVLASLPYGYSGRIDFAFMNHDRYLVCCGDDNRLTLWDTETGKLLMEEADSDASIGSIYTDGSEHYFAAGFYGYEADNYGFQSSQLWIYFVDDAGRFYRFADVPYGYVSFEGDEIFVRNDGGTYGSIYSYQELRARAETLLEGQSLTEAEKRQYFIL